MPLVGLGGYMLSRHGGSEPSPIAPPELCGEFMKLKISSACDRISGKLFLNFNLHRCSYDGIKIRLNLHLKPVITDRVNAVGGETDLFEHCPIETSLPGGVFRAQKRLNFILDIPKNQVCPTSFISSQGSLTYRLVALITRDKHVTWTVIANKLLLDFKGYYNISGMELGPSVDFKQFFEEKITAIFTLNKPVLLIGRDTNLTATLELEGVRDYNVDVTLTLQRRAKCAENVRAEIIILQKQQTDCCDDTTVFNWNFNVPNISRATYVNELTPVYSVRYFAKYEATFKPLNDQDGICIDGIGFIEVKVGTTSESSSSTSAIANRFDNLTLASRSDSASSLMTLPPPYSTLSSRSGSVLSLETQPPGYDDLY
ncbi:uncharacterized protein LOC119075438 [Bradysia coprophila]|uniref:uncharacterized protein LOC119075438 n=1 Tax=Bradysia coprophila TaxID=38358 RepID=UPI00187D8B70|nr:uncharacterized protein LOC119075438 [Bradysia coprophila]